MYLDISLRWGIQSRRVIADFVRCAHLFQRRRGSDHGTLAAGCQNNSTLRDASTLPNARNDRIFSSVAPDARSADAPGSADLRVDAGTDLGAHVSPTRGADERTPSSGHDTCIPATDSREVSQGVAALGEPGSQEADDTHIEQGADTLLDHKTLPCSSREIGACTTPHLVSALRERLVPVDSTCTPVAMCHETPIPVPCIGTCTGHLGLD